MFITVLIFIAVLAILVLSHELGHFVVAKKSGMRVDEFGFGFPPKILGIKRGETTYSFNLVPLGGFVKIFGEDGEDRNKPKSFSSKPIWKRALVISAGVFLNFVLAYILFSVAHTLGTPTLISDNDPAANFKNVSVQIVEVAQDSPAQQAGVKLGDRIEKLSAPSASIAIHTVTDVQNFISKHMKEEITFSIKRGGEELNLNIHARENFPEGQGSTGIALVRVELVTYPWYIAIVEGAKTFWLSLSGTLYAFGNMIRQAVTSGTLPSDISGPIGIAYMTGAVRNLGFVYLLQFIALISLNLGIINLIPFPALDGGRLLFLGIEKLKGSPVPKKIEGVTHAIGFVILILLMIAVTFHDVDRFF